MEMRAASGAVDRDGINAVYRAARRTAASRGYKDAVQPPPQEFKTTELNPAVPAADAEG